MFLIYISKGKIGHTGNFLANSSYKSFQVCCLWDVSLTYPGWNDVYVELLPQTHAQYALCSMFLLHIQAEMVPTGTPPTNPYPVCSVMDLSLKIQAEMVPIGNSFHKPTPGTLLRECFFYIFKAKIGLTGTLRWLLLQVVPSMLSMGCFSYTFRLKWCLWRKSPTKPCPELSLWDVSLTHPGWNGA